MNIFTIYGFSLSMQRIQMKDTSHFDPMNSLVFLTNRVGRLLGNMVRKHAAADGIEIMPTQIGIMVDLWMQEGLRQQDLVVSIIKDKGTVARAIDALEKENMVVRIPDPLDKRYKRIYLTHKGKEMEYKLAPHARSAESLAVEGITENELNVCKKVLAKIYWNLNK